MATHEPQHDHNVLRISRDAFGLASCTLQVNAPEDQPLVFACLAPLCQSLRVSSTTRGAVKSLNGGPRRFAGIRAAVQLCTCQQETSGGSSFLLHIYVGICEDIALPVRPAFVGRT